MDKAYFNDYCGHGSYAENYLHHSGVEHCIEVIERYAIPIDSVLVLGAATGEVLSDFKRAWGARPWGCEISRWAHARIPARYRERIQCADLRQYLPRLARGRRSFDLLFCNSLVYLEPNEIDGVLELCSRVAGHFHSLTSTSENFEEGDRYRVTLRPGKWWRKRFLRNGFERTRSPYLWRSHRRDLWD